MKGKFEKLRERNGNVGECFGSTLSVSNKHEEAEKFQTL